MAKQITPQRMLIFFLFDFLNNIVAELSLYYNTLVRDLQERKRWKQLLYSPATFIILLVITGLLVNADYNIYKKSEIAKINRQQSDTRLAALQAKSQNLNAELAKLKTDRGIEEELRDKFQITKEGEEDWVVVDSNKPAMPTSSARQDEDYWQEIKKFFGN